MLVAGERGRGVAEEAGVLEDIDLYEVHIEIVERIGTMAVGGDDLMTFGKKSQRQVVADQTTGSGYGYTHNSSVPMGVPRQL